ncbi:hypothetical protein IFM89_007976 [Coptis chinensis]|uniref:Cytochrome b5 heme-binding domain-containing protein n=1 Tax=Coptis chinensis TaxID=261450 RepID=A0A835IIM6_9MAGN|nr:hypothetical protein IFM89_007976 [Coptis chinensis]
MTSQRVFTLSQVAQHKSNKNCCLDAVYMQVLDVTKFLEEHPGGSEVLLESAGKDATKDFEIIGHSKAAQGMLLKYQVGILEDFRFEGEAEEVTHEETRGKEMTAFVIKEDVVPKYSEFLEFFVPFLVAGFYLGYRLLTKATDIKY